MPFHRPAGFKTELGSLYSLNARGQTTRYKVSPGTGQGERQEQALLCWYLTEEDCDRLDAAHGHLLFAFKTETGPLQFLSTLDAEIPGDAAPCLIVSIEKQDVCLAVSKMPAPGLYPLEAGSHLHFGHKITDVYETAEELNAEIRRAGFVPAETPSTPPRRGPAP